MEHCHRKLTVLMCASALTTTTPATIRCVGRREAANFRLGRLARLANSLPAPYPGCQRVNRALDRRRAAAPCVRRHRRRNDATTAKHAGTETIASASSCNGKTNIPLGLPGSLTDQQAWHVALYINSYERPEDPRCTISMQGTPQDCRAAEDSMDGRVVAGTVPGASGAPRPFKPLRELRP